MRLCLDISQHLRWSIFENIVKCLKPLTILTTPVILLVYLSGQLYVVLSIKKVIIFVQVLNLTECNFRFLGCVRKLAHTCTYLESKYINMFLLMESHIFVFLAGNGCKWGKDGLVCAPLRHFKGAQISSYKKDLQKWSQTKRRGTRCHMIF